MRFVYLSGIHDQEFFVSLRQVPRLRGGTRERFTFVGRTDGWLPHPRAGLAMERSVMTDVNQRVSGDVIANRRSGVQQRGKNQ